MIIAKRIKLLCQRRCPVAHPRERKPTPTPAGAAPLALQHSHYKVRCFFRANACLQVDVSRALLALNLAAIALVDTLGNLALALHGANLRDLRLEDPEVVALVLLARGLPHAELEEFLLGVDNLRVELVVGHGLEIRALGGLEAREGIRLGLGLLALGAHHEAGAALLDSLAGHDGGARL